MKRTYLGEFEKIVLLLVAGMDGEAYGVGLTHKLNEETESTAYWNGSRLHTGWKSCKATCTRSLPTRLSGSCLTGAVALLAGCAGVHQVLCDQA